VQRLVTGHEANSTAACWNGKVLANITVGVLQTLGDRGPSSVVRVISHGEVSASVEKIVARLKLSGLFGFDFIFESLTGDPHLIEMNPRATQICHLAVGPGGDLVASLVAAVAGTTRIDTQPVTQTDIISFFPQEWLRDPASQFLQTTHHDVPWDEPRLVRACIEEAYSHRVWDALTPAMAKVSALLDKGKAPSLGSATVESLKGKMPS
jgi:hypothetical protein